MAGITRYLQFRGTNGWYRYFGSVSSIMGNLPKSCACTLRCVSE
jgi:hypothetical protein